MTKDDSTDRLFLTRRKMLTGAPAAAAAAATGGGAMAAAAAVAVPMNSGEILALLKKTLIDEWNQALKSLGVTEEQYSLADRIYEIQTDIKAVFKTKNDNSNQDPNTDTNNLHESLAAVQTTITDIGHFNTLGIGNVIKLLQSLNSLPDDICISDLSSNVAETVLTHPIRNPKVIDKEKFNSPISKEDFSLMCDKIHVLQGRFDDRATIKDIKTDLHKSLLKRCLEISDLTKTPITITHEHSTKLKHLIKRIRYNISLPKDCETNFKKLSNELDKVINGIGYYRELSSDACKIDLYETKETINPISFGCSVKKIAQKEFEKIEAEQWSELGPTRNPDFDACSPTDFYRIEPYEEGALPLTRLHLFQYLRAADGVKDLYAGQIKVIRVSHEKDDPNSPNQSLYLATANKGVAAHLDKIDEIDIPSLKSQISLSR